jgi:streptogramin lyase
MEGGIRQDLSTNPSGGNRVMALEAADDGSVWVGIETPGHGGGLQHVVGGVMQPFAVPKLKGETLRVCALLMDRQGSLWVGTFNQGLYRIHGTDVDHFGSANGLSSDAVNHLFEDQEGNLWVATSKGLDMLRHLPVSTFSTSEGVSEDEVESVLAARDGTVWIGSNHLQALEPGGL